MTATTTTPPPAAGNNYADSIVQTWPWTKGYPPWLAELRLALDDFGRDTGLVDRLGEPVHVGGIFAPTLRPFCPCANTPFNAIDWYAIEASFKTPKAAGVKPKEPLCGPPWEVEDCNRPKCPPCTNPDYPSPYPLCPGCPPPPPGTGAKAYYPTGWNGYCELPVNFLPRPPVKYTYFVYYDSVRALYVGRSFFQCEQTFCAHGESAFFLVSDFSGLEYIGNLVDTPEKLLLTLASEIPGSVSPDMLRFGSSYVNKVNNARHFW
jgi:hypothetical protein